MQYPVVIHKDDASDYGVTVPDLPGCFSAGATRDEALAMAREAIELHIHGLMDMGQPVPTAGSVAAHRSNPDYRGGVWALVPVNPDSLRPRARRINITLPESVLAKIDRAAGKRRQTRSGWLAQAVGAYLFSAGTDKNRQRPTAARRPRRHGLQRLPRARRP